MQSLFGDAPGSRRNGETSPIATRARSLARDGAADHRSLYGARDGFSLAAAGVAGRFFSGDAVVVADRTQFYISQSLPLDLRPTHAERRVTVCALFAADERGGGHSRG